MSIRTGVNPDEIVAGVVGLGLMGTSIVVSLLVAGHRVIALAPITLDLQPAPARIRQHLLHCEHSGLLSAPVSSYLDRLTISDNYDTLSDCDIVMECVIELPDIKAAVFRKIETVVREQSIIASNTSAIPISDLQQLVQHPERFLGIHWAEPSYLTRFLEITCGNHTDYDYAEWVFRLAHHWGKEPTLLRKDIRGFVTNRLMYAVYREAFALMDNTSATKEDLDKAFRYDAGSWMTLMGVFRRMDFLGLEDYREIFKNIFPLLSNDEKVPAIMQQIVEQKLRGTQSGKGLYEYTADEANKWNEAFAAFNEDIYKLAAMYPASIAATSNRSETVNS